MPAPKRRVASPAALLRAAERRELLQDCINDGQPEVLPTTDSRNALPSAPAVNTQPYVFALVYRNGQKGDRVRVDLPSFTAARRHAASVFMADKHAIGVLVREASDGDQS
jgi:hypothetical protein